MSSHERHETTRGDASRLMDALDDIVIKSGHPGPEWLTVRDMAEAKGCTTSYINSMMHKMMAEGRVERVLRKGPRGGAPVYYYRLLE